METNDVTLEKLREAISIMENYTREPQRISEILPLVITVLKERATDVENTQGDTKFYTPMWVSVLLNRLCGEDKKPLSNEDRMIYGDMVSKLSFDDFKPAKPGLFSYEVQYTTPQRISEIIRALRHYFGLI